MTPKADASLRERRSIGDRFTAPPCQRCEQDGVSVVSRTEYVLYLRCSSCGHVWSVAKPGREALGS